MDLLDTTAAQRSKATRSSLACLPCRSRHLKCDGKRPQCSRCIEVAKQCHYAQSRRGGAHRSTLAERRSQAAVVDGVASFENLPTPPISHLPPADHQNNQDQSPAYRLTDANLFNIQDEDLSTQSSGTVSPTAPLEQYYSIKGDKLIDAYYQNFHRFHPMVLPQRHLIRLYQDRDRQDSFMPLIAVLRLIGQLYESQLWSTELQEFVETCFGRASPTDPVMAQCRLLYSIVLFWQDHKAKSQSEWKAAAQLALDLGMPRQEFAVQHGSGDPVLTECWRRTWWMLFTIDAYYAGTLGTRELTLVGVEATVDLPCREPEYETGDIPPPKTLEDFNCREFFPDAEFSSFSYLIGAVKCAGSAIAMTPRTTDKQASIHVIQDADAMIDGWLLLLPKDRKQIMSRSGEVDELMFQAHLVIHVALVGLHRPLSELRFNAVEGHSSCAREPRPDMAVTEQISVHTIRVLRSVEAQVRILALPARPFNHSPFTTCMVSEGILALLSACNFLLKGKELGIARDQIRMIIGCLKALGEIWSRTARNVSEIQYIARHVFGLQSKGTNENTPNSSEGRNSSSEEIQQRSGSDAETLSSDAFCSMDAIGDLCGWFSSEDLSRELTWWANE
ncbi:hypothetical protein JX266_007137 [Neoarthrinium moseri]|uniref:uncharacterized protein n=1 Tax=Neoarthrinium moseri TaxID=1658444 RepID=UPI001FDDDB13|nr:uncharacterized protein JN550_003611 [Neoarthrinium moseri]KAI1846916.1 hypothetical protein JX266_007137 [Neoarthrinium moseri]KAI1872737.1 hypothetical protein JN550_003611 [Neoarthrinium moseri]